MTKQREGKHTAGPWSTVKHSNGIGIESPTRIIGLVWGENCEPKANARLIASAPELKDMLEDIANVYADDEGNVTLIAENIREIKALLAKAEGGEE